MTIETPQMIKIGEAAFLLGVTPWTLRNWEAKGIFFPTYKSKGGTRYYSTDIIHKIIEANHTHGYIYELASNRKLYSTLTTFFGATNR